MTKEQKLTIIGKQYPPEGLKLHGHDWEQQCVALDLSLPNHENIRVEIGRRLADGTYEESSDEFLIENGIDPKTKQPKVSL